MRNITWDEISRHNRSSDCWVVVDGCVYNITEWIQHHPGGNAIQALAGEDISSLYHSSHLRPGHTIPDAFKIGIVKDYNAELPSCNDAFMTALKVRVLDYFIKQKIDYRNTQKNQKSIFYTSSLLFMCWGITYFLPPLGLMAAIIMGFCTCALIGAFGHEQIHGNLAEKTGAFHNIVDAIRWGLFIPFMPKAFFQYEHLKHHSHPMHPDHDYDVRALQGLVRLSGMTKKKRRHAYQHLYAPLVYANYIFLQLISGYTSRFFESRGLLREKHALSHIIFSSITAFSFHIVLPIYVAGFWWALAGISIYFLTWQSAIYISSGLPHMTMEIDHGKKQESWPKYVCMTTRNLKCGSRFFDWLTGGLNHHLTHHLLPSIPRDHLHSIQHIVEETCLQFHYPYCTYQSFFDYYLDHYRVLKLLGHRSNARN